LESQFDWQEWIEIITNTKPDQVDSALEKHLSKVPNEKIDFDAIICVSGGWKGGNIKSNDILTTSNVMFHANTLTSVLAGHAASKYLKKGGLLVLTGAQAAVGPTPDMIAYGISKAATHHLTKSLAVSKAMPQGSIVTAICPLILDTQPNREAMPNADFSTWTNTQDVATILLSWAEGKGKLPQTGSLIKFEKAKDENKTTWNEL